MDLIINNTDELNEYLGFLDVDVEFKELKSKIVYATNDIIDQIGQAIYDLAVAEYEKENGDAFFILHVATPIAIQAYRKYAPQKDVSHTNKGRISRIEENEKTPFDWQIEDSNNALERDYYESLDKLIKYLDVNITAWKQTDQYKKSANLFISNASTFDDLFPIGKSRLLFLKLAPGIRKFQNSDIKKRLGEELCTSLLDGSTTNDALVLKIQDALVAASMAWAYRRYSVQMFPEGVVQSYISDRNSKYASKPGENNEAFIAAQFFEKDYKEYLREIESMVEEINRKPDETIEPLTFKSDPNDKFISM